jgi:hypothetical protein
MSHAIVFAARCPQCRRDQLQDNFTVADLMELLYGGDPIDAYCAFCGRFWTVSVQQRVELGEVVAAACGAAAPLPPPQLKMVID